jgi:hypothetical protein
VSLNPAYDEVYLIQLYSMKFFSDWLAAGLCILWVLRFPPQYNWNISKSGIKHHKSTNHNYVRKYLIIYLKKKSTSGNRHSTCLIFFVFNDLRWEAIVHFVDHGGFVDHQCWNFLFITKNKCGILTQMLYSFHDIVVKTYYSDNSTMIDHF